MTHSQMSAFVLIIIIFLCSPFARAQEPKSNEQKTADARLRDKAFDLLESLADQIGTLQSAENRARLGSSIAASLWTHDEQRARSLLVSVKNDLNTVLQDPSDDLRDDQTRVVFLQLRVDTIERIARYDADLALEFLKGTEPVSDETVSYNMKEAERALDMRLAKQLANERPEMALKLARKMLASGFSYDLHTLLRQINRKHKDQALILYKEIVAKLRDADIRHDSGTFYFALQLAHSFKPPAADEQTFRQLIGIFIASSLAAGCDKTSSEDNEESWFCVQISGLLPEIAKIDSSLAARLRQWAQDDEPQSQWDPEAYEELNEVFETGTVDDVLALATKYPEMKNVVNARALEKALISGDLERAKKMAAEIEDPETRQYLAAEIDRVQKLASTNEERLGQVQQALNTIPKVEEQLQFLLYAANQIGANDRKAALKLLSQANDIVDGLKPGREQTEAQVSLAMMYCLEKSDRGLELMQAMMPKLNELVSSASKLDGYENHYLRDGEWNMSSEGSVGNILTGLAQNAGYFSWCDFDRAVGIAAQFERPELRMMAQLKIAQGVLTGPPKRFVGVGRRMRY